MNGKILIIDDEKEIRESLKAILEDENYSVETSASFTGSLPENTAMVFLDVWLEKQNGLEVLPDLLRQNQNPGIIMISGHANIDLAIDAIRKGAYDFIEKPLRLERVLTSVQNCLQNRQIRMELESSRRNLLSRYSMRSRDEGLLGTVAHLERLKPRGKGILIRGEAGTGKIRLATYASLFHHPAGEPTLVDCTTLNRDEISALLMKAPGGQSLILREIADFPPPLFGLLQQILEGGESTLYFTTCRADQLPGIFPEPLLKKMQEFTFTLPPLRERVTDIHLLSSYFSEVASAEFGREPIRFDGEASLLLESYSWPGNISELRNFTEKLAIFSSGTLVGRETVDVMLREEGLNWKSPGALSSLKQALQHFERNYILYVVRRNNGNMSRAARDLDIERTHLYRKLKKLGLENIREELRNDE